MKFVNIDIENFLAIGNAKLDLCDRGLLLIQGDNRDDTSQNSNGAGKSSVVDALCWVLFGQTAREESGDTVINRKMGKNCRVRALIKDGDDEYLITRHRKFTKKRNVLEVVKNGKEELTKGTDKLTQTVVDAIIGCSYDVFRASIYAGQERQVDLPNMTDKFLKQIVEEAAGIDRLQQAHALAKERMGEAKTKLDALQSDITNLEMSEEQDQIEIDIAQNQAKEFEAKTEEEKERFTFRIGNKKKSAGEVVAKLKTIDKAALDAEFEALSDGSEAEKWHAKFAELSDIYNQSAREVEGLKKELSDTARKAKVIKADIDTVGDVVGQPCSKCGKPHTEDDVAPRREALQGALDETMSRIAELKTAFSEASDTQRMRSEELEAFKTTKVSDEEGKARRAALRAQIDEHNELLSKARVLKSEIVSDTEALKALDERENPHVANVKRREDILADTREKLSAAKDKLAALEKELFIAQGVVEVYGNSGVRAHILDTVTPYLNARTAEYLGQLSDGNLSATWNTLATTTKGELREQFHIEVTSLTGGDSYRQLSGGEKRKVRLATNMALQDLVSSRASKPIDLYIGDEIDHALDVSGLERLMGVLEERAKVQGTVLVISHNELSDWIRESITVVKEDGLTTIVE